MSTYLVNRSPSSAIGFKTPVDMNMGFNESGDNKKTFIGSGVVQVQCRCCKELSLRWNRKRIIHLREQHSAWELFSYREDSNEAAFAVAAVDKIYAHESLTFNNTVSCKVISKWNARLKDDMDARSACEGVGLCPWRRHLVDSGLGFSPPPHIDAVTIGCDAVS
ncbi:hypothetical protein Tco_1498069 [Tanacetum coccineum]